MLKLFRPARVKMTMSAMALVVAVRAAVLILSAEPAYACSPGGGNFGQLGGIFDWLFARK